MRTEGVEAGNEGGVGFSHSPPAVGVAAWCATRKEVLPGIFARLSRNEAIVLPCFRFPIPHPLSLPSPRLRLNHPIYLQLRISKSFNPLKPTAPTPDRRSREQCISNILSHPATLDSTMLKSFTREYQVLYSAQHVQNARRLLLQSRACLLGCPWIGTGRCTAVDYRRNNRYQV